MVVNSKKFAESGPLDRSLPLCPKETREYVICRNYLTDAREKKVKNKKKKSQINHNGQ